MKTDKLSSYLQHYCNIYNVSYINPKYFNTEFMYSLEKMEWEDRFWGKSKKTKKQSKVNPSE